MKELPQINESAMNAKTCVIFFNLTDECGRKLQGVVPLSY